MTIVLGKVIPSDRLYELIKKSGVCPNLIKDIEKTCRRRLAESNKVSIELYQYKAFERYSERSKYECNAYKDTYIAYVTECIANKEVPISLKDFAEDKFPKLDFEGFVKILNEEIQEFYKQCEDTSLTPEDFYYKDKIEDYSIQSEYEKFLDPGDYDLKHVIQNDCGLAVKKLAYEMYYDYAIGIDTDVHQIDDISSFMEKVNDEYSDKIDMIEKIFGDRKLSIISTDDTI